MKYEKYHNTSLNSRRKKREKKTDWDTGYPTGNIPTIYNFTKNIYENMI